jgi:NAD(P)-dependent dehydrogenase (short-subunit alcohol dehydrogenase family)
MKKLQDMLSLRGKVAFITGGAGYLGTAMCEALAEQGATVVVVSRDAAKCEALATRLTQEYGTPALGLGVNILKPEEIGAALKRTVDTYGQLDILINNAWSGNKNSFDTISYEHWEYDIDMCLNAVFYTVKEAAEYLKISHGVILNTASMYGHVAPDYRIYDGVHLMNPPSYGAAKAGVIQLTKYLASFLSPHKIRVNAISPGPFPFPETGTNNPEFWKTLEGKNMLGRCGEPDDLKGVTALLCSDASAYITGQNFCVDGGWAAW